MERKRVSVWRLIRRHLLWVPLIPLVVTLVFVAISRSETSRARALDAFGVDAFALVTRLDQRIRRERDGDRTEYFVHFSFQPVSGPPVVLSRSISRSRYLELREGDEIPIRYVAHDPGVTEFAAGERAAAGFWSFWLAVAAGSATLGSAIWALRRKMAVLRAAWTGEVRQAEVTAHLASGTRINSVLQFRLAWRDALGVEGKSGLFDPARLPPPGTVIVVYIDPKSGKGFWDAEF
jgi:hypothetical protein